MKWPPYIPKEVTPDILDEVTPDSLKVTPDIFEKNNDLLKNALVIFTGKFT